MILRRLALMLGMVMTAASPATAGSPRAQVHDWVATHQREEHHVEHDLVGVVGPH